MPTSTACIFANGEIENLEAVRPLLKPDTFLVAADGGLRHLVALGRLPDLLIGDLDSVGTEDVEMVKQSGVSVMQYPVQKDETDLELAVLAAVQRGCLSIVILGALGGRIDMTLANISLLMLPELAGVDARLDDGTVEVFLIRPADTGREITGQAGDTVSLLPWGGPARGIVTTGLFYPLSGETLFPERTRGISNQMLSGRARVSLAHGLLVCIHTHAG